MSLQTVDDIDDSDATTPTADLYQHLANLGEFAVLLAVGLGISFVALHNRTFEIILAIAYIIAITYLALNFAYAPRAQVFRAVAITLGVVLGFREIILLFPLPIMQSAFSLIGGIFLCYRAVKWGWALLH